MNVQLTPALQRLVQRKVRDGRYKSASEVVRAALRLLDRQDQVQQDMRRKIREGWDSLRRGEGVDGEAFMSELESELDRMERLKRAG